jgi:hypothetical protein
LQIHVKTVRNLSGIFLLFTLLAPAWLGYGWLQWEKMQLKRAVKTRMIAGMDRGELLLLAFTREEARHSLEWEHADEFEWCGRMYDVVERHSRGDSLLYWCWPDDEETSLNQRLATLLSRAWQADPQQEQEERLITFFISLYHPQSVQWHFVSQCDEKKRPPAGAVAFLSPAFPPPTPPPDAG